MRTYRVMLTNADKLRLTVHVNAIGYRDASQRAEQEVNARDSEHNRYGPWTAQDTEVAS